MMALKPACSLTGHIDKDGSRPFFVLILSGLCRRNGAAVALEHAQLCCSGQDPKEAWCAGLHTF